MLLGTTQDETTSEAAVFLTLRRGVRIAQSRVPSSCAGQRRPQRSHRSRDVIRRLNQGFFALIFGIIHLLRLRLLCGRPVAEAHPQIARVAPKAAAPEYKQKA